MEELEVDGIDETSGRILIVEVEWWISGVHYTMLFIYVWNFPHTKKWLLKKDNSKNYQNAFGELKIV